MFFLGHAGAYEDAHLSQSRSQRFLLISHAFLSLHQVVNRNMVLLLLEAYEAEGWVICIDCNRIIADKSAIIASAISAERSIYLLDYTNSDTHSL